MHWNITYLFFLALIGFQPLRAQEICDNGLDDDNDSLVDLNDPDCRCKGIKDTLFVPSSLIPNPSFEDFVCCPSGLAQLNCSRNWIQASSATSDYYHTCGFKEDPQRGKPPQPLPAGNGYVGFLDIENFALFRSRYKEYVGACLTAPMLPGKDYTLSFWVGFGSKGSQWGPRSSTTLSIFGTNLCANLPFGDLSRNDNSRCPTSYNTGTRTWFEMSRITAAGFNRWVKVNVKLKPSSTVEAIVIGPQCAATDGDYYFWMDELLLEETAKFDSIILDIKGNPCTDTIVLNAPKTTIQRIRYQWYRDGIAINGANSPDYIIPKGQEGRYVLRASDGPDCELSNVHDYKIVSQKKNVRATICEGEVYQIGAQMFDTTGMYDIFLSDRNGCDSIVTLELSVLRPGSSTLDTSICSGQVLRINGTSFNTSGTYNQIIKTAAGCDSNFVIQLKVVDHIFDTLNQAICKGEVFRIDTASLNTTGIYSYNYKSSGNCDSTLVLNLKVNEHTSQTIDTAICAGTVIRINNTDYSSQGSYPILLKNTNACDSNLLLQLSVNPVYSIDLDTSFCEGEKMVIANQTIDKPGLSNIFLKSVFGCDSILNVHITQYPVLQKLIDTTICEGDWFAFANTQISEEGTYLFDYSNQFGCDSQYTIQLRVLRKDSIIIDTAICEGKAIIFNGNSIDIAGNYVASLKNVFACDSIVSLSLKNYPNYRNNLSQRICFGEKYRVGNNTYEQAGKYTVALSSQFGCDSTVILDLSVDPVYSQKLDTTICFDQKIIIAGTAFDAPGNFTIPNISQMGCDSSISISIKKSLRPQIISQLQHLKCANDNNGIIQLQVIGGNGPFIYQWSNGNSTNQLSGLKAGKYRLTLVDQLNCFVNEEYEIVEPLPLQLELSVKDATCLNEDAGYLFVKLASGGQKPYYLLVDGKKYMSLDSIPLSLGNHLIQLVDSNLCQLSKDVSINPPQRGELQVDPITADLIIGDTLYINASLANVNSIQSVKWTGSGQIDCDTCLNTFVIAKQKDAFYELRIIDKNGCVYIEKISYRAKKGFYVPNVFSPNSDGVNDYFHLFSDRSVASIDIMRIFDRWGEIIYEERNLLPNQQERSWDGTFRQKPMMPGVYLYYLQFKDKAGEQHILTGDVTLIR